MRVAIVSDSHDRAYVERIGNVAGGQTWLLNPGSVAGLGGPATWLLADLATLQFEIRACE